jgi:hypothetical protein
MDFEKYYIRKKEGTFVTKFPFLRLCDWQKDAFVQTIDATQIVYYIPRRAGKTTLLAYTFFFKLIYQKEIMKFGQKYICCHPVAQTLYEKFVQEWFSTMFGGSENLQDNVNNVWIPIPRRYLNYFENTVLNEKEMEWFFGDVEMIKEVDGVKYIKFLHDEFKDNKHGVCTGVLFNGAIISLIPAYSNASFDKNTSGSAIFGVWAEELSQWKEDFVSKIALPAVAEKGGFVMSSATPPKVGNPKEHWSYKGIIQPTMTGKQYVKETEHFVDYYKYIRTTTLPVRIDGEVVDVEKTYKSVVIIGDYVKMFPYTPAGIDGFRQQVAELKVHVKISGRKDDQKQYINDQYGNIAYKVEFGLPNPAGKMPLDVFDREFRMSFDGVMGDSVIDKFKEEVNVVDISDIDISKFPRICGFDKGLKDMTNGFKFDDSTYTSGRDRSATMYIDIAYLGNNQWLVYGEGYMNFTYEDVGRFLYSRLKVGIPVVFDNVMDRQDSIGRNGQRDSSMTRTIRSYKPLQNQDLIAGLIPCKKFQETEKIKIYNSLFDTENKEIMLRNAKIPLLNRSNIYISSKCVDTIKFFKTWKTAVKDKNHQIRDEVFDCLTYPIDAYRLDESKKDSITNFWKNYAKKKYKGSILTNASLKRNVVIVKN